MVKRLFIENPFRAPGDQAYKIFFNTITVIPVDIDLDGEPPFDEVTDAEVLFKADIPSQAAYSAKDSFLHYLSTLRLQCKQLSLPTYDETFDIYSAYLKTAADLIGSMREKGIFDRRRSYLSAMDASESAITAFNSQMGTQMKLEWNEMDK